MPDETPEFAYYYPNQYWFDPDWIKTLILFFDGIANLIPEYMPDTKSFDDYPIAAALADQGLYRIIRPEHVVDEDATKELAEAMIEIIAAGRLDGLDRETEFGSLSKSRMGYSGNKELADFIFQELKSRGLATDSEDGLSIPMHGAVRSLILVLLAQILRPVGSSMGLTLSPATDQWRLVAALEDLITSDSTKPPSVGDVVSFDLTMVGVDLRDVPLEEVLDFRRQYHADHRNYALSVRKFARDLSVMPESERSDAFEQRQEELEDAAASLRRIHRQSWKRPVSFGLSLAGAAWNYVSGDPIAAALAGGAAAFDLSPSATAGDEVGVYSYLFSARSRF
jgi:hypothetical protein